MENRSTRTGGPEQIKNPAEMLKVRLSDQSILTNSNVEREYGLGGLLLPDATIDPVGYSDIYSQEELAKDAVFIHDREREFSGADKQEVRDFYKTEYGVNTEEEHIAKWREKKIQAKSGQMEMAVTALLAEKLGKDFLVVRTAPYDDYANGVDNLILDRVTGEVVGAFDEVHDGGDGRDTEKKRLKVQNIAKRGGAKIRYGLRLENGKLTRASLAGVPVFYLGLSGNKPNDELGDLVQGLATGDSAKTDLIYKKLLASLEVQHSELEKCAGTPALRARLSSFKKSLTRLMANITPSQKAA